MALDGARSTEREAVVEVYEAGEGTWKWRYREPLTDVELDSNNTFSSRDAAAGSARRAYPDLAIAGEGESPDRGSRAHGRPPRDGVEFVLGAVTLGARLRSRFRAIKSRRRERR